MRRRKPFMGFAVLVLSALVSAARPYDDTKGRFHLQLPDGWVLAPQFGDTQGMVFQKKVEARRATSLCNFVVRVDDIEARDAKDYATKNEVDLAKQPGFEKTSEKSALVGGQPALVREYRALASKKPRIEKRIRAHYLDVNGHIYMLHFETTARDFAKLEDDMAKILASFEARAGTARSTSSSDTVAPVAAPISGRWINEDGLVLALGDDASFALAEASGRYEVQGETLTLIIPGQGRESFTFVHDPVKGTLTLSSANLGTPMVYRRAGAGRTESAQSPPPAKSAPASPGGDLIGRWSTATPNGPLVLELNADKSFTMGQMHGAWSTAGDGLTLARSAGESIAYHFQLAGDRLLLRGGDLEDEVVFQRQR